MVYFDRYLSKMDEGRGLWALVKVFCALLSHIYGIFIQLRYLLFRTGVIKTFHIDKTVISIGNITSGGTGKTPAVKLVAEICRKHGALTCILSRGYKGGEEARMLRKKLPYADVLVGKNRCLTGLRARADACILDDGFQYLSLHRDLDIVVIDSTMPFGNGRLIPRGGLREKPDSLIRADILLLTRTDLVENHVLETLKKKLEVYGKPMLYSKHKPVDILSIDSPERSMGLGYLSGKRIVALSSIGNPGAFRMTLEGLGAEVVRDYTFPDHYGYSRADIFGIDRDIAAGNIIVTTEKDRERLPSSLSGYFVLCVELEITSNMGVLDEAVLSCIKNRTNS